MSEEISAGERNISTSEEISSGEREYQHEHADIVRRKNISA
ncbi:hypothetical protein [Oceanobacillus chungangensis]|nr:hypothetical protein [Oceanobacillus chungangensis]